MFSEILFSVTLTHYVRDFKNELELQSERILLLSEIEPKKFRASIILMAAVFKTNLWTSKDGNILEMWMRHPLVIDSSKNNSTFFTMSAKGLKYEGI